MEDKTFEIVKLQRFFKADVEQFSPIERSISDPICKEENLWATALYYMAGFASLQGEASPVLLIW